MSPIVSAEVIAIWDEVNVELEKIGADEQYPPLVALRAYQKICRGEETLDYPKTRRLISQIRDMKGAREDHFIRIAVVAMNSIEEARAMLQGGEIKSWAEQAAEYFRVRDEHPDDPDFY